MTTDPDPTAPGRPTLLVLPDPDAVTQAACDLLVDALGRALVDRGTAVLALSGGSTPVPLYRRLAAAELDWRSVHVVQVDERVAEEEDPDRNWRAIASALVEPTGAVGHPMPVLTDPLEEGAAAYAAELAALGAIDVLHLGLGGDGHTASLVPGDPVVEVDDVDVAATGVYQERRRMTLTAPAIDRARRIVWQVVDEDKREAFGRLREGVPGDPSARVRRSPEVWIVADEAVAGAGADAG